MKAPKSIMVAVQVLVLVLVLAAEAKSEDERFEITSYCDRLGDLANGIDEFISQSRPAHAYWLDNTYNGGRPGIVLCAAPIDISKPLKETLLKSHGESPRSEHPGTLVDAGRAWLSDFQVLPSCASCRFSPQWLAI